MSCLHSYTGKEREEKKEKKEQKKRERESRMDAFVSEEMRVRERERTTTTTKMIKGQSLRI